MIGARALYAAASLSGVQHLARRAQRGRLLIVCYHGLREDAEPTRHWLLVPRSAFEAQIAYLSRHYECLPIDAALERLWAGDLRAPTACVTFDDGYRSNLELGLPVLERYGVPATIYLATGLIGTDQRLWTTTVELSFRGARAERVDLSPFGLGVVRLEDAGRRAALGRAVAAAMKTRPARERRALQAELLPRLDAGAIDERGAFALLDWAGVERLAGSGLVTFGGHTVSHELLSRLDDDALEHEITESIAAVRRAVPDARSSTFAYPNGGPDDYDARAEAILARSGCTAAVTTDEGLNTPAVPRLRLRRVSVGGDDPMARFVVVAAGLPQLLPV